MGNCATTTAANAFLPIASRYETEFVKAAIGQMQQDAQAEQQAMQKQLKDLQKRAAELDNLLQRIYEDSESGRITVNAELKLHESAG